MATNVVYLPGILGSNLGYPLPPQDTYHPVWLDLQAVLEGQLKYLELAADGVSPGPLALGISCSPNGIFQPAYGALDTFMRLLGWNVVSEGYDWRKSVITEAPKVLAAAQAAFGTAPFWIVAHSQGGLLARAVYALMVSAAATSQLAGLVTICSPHFGSFEIVRLFNRMPFSYRALVLATGWKDWSDGRPGPPYLDAILASHPGFYELLPFAAAGPLFASDPAQAAALYTAASYASGNPFVVPNLFTEAETVQTILQTAIPASGMTTIVGKGERTAYSLSGTAAPNTDAGYLYTLDGDGIVTVAQATLPGIPIITLSVSHALAPLNPLVWLEVRNIIGG
jgi:pimeloyl-ACP methyl ester carboxylesterase